MKRESKGISLRAKSAILVLLLLVAGGLGFLYWQGYINSYSVAQADDFWVDQSFHAPLLELRSSPKEVERVETIDQDKREPVALIFPQASELPPPSDTASWTGIAPLEEGKVVQIILSVQRLLAWQDGELIGNFLASTGKPGFETLQGSFKVLTKTEVAYGAGDGDQWAMPYWIGFYVAGGSENGIHALPYINGYKEGWGSLGRPVSHGCVRIADASQIWLYNWVSIGTPIVVQWGIDTNEVEGEEIVER